MISYLQGMVAARPTGDLVELVNEVLELRRKLVQDEIPFPTRTVLLQIHTNLLGFQGIRGVAEQTDCSPSHLREHFKVHVGVSPRAYLQAFRAFVAFEQLVRAPGLSIEHVAEAAGYSCRSSLGHAFRRHTGLPPGWVRRALRGRRFAPDVRGLVEAAVQVRQVAEKQGRVAPLPRARAREIRQRILTTVRELQRRAPPLHSLGRPP